MNPAIAALLARTAARKAAGISQVYPQHSKPKSALSIPVNPLRPCLHRGEPTGELESCGSCKGRVSLKVFHCAALGTCTIARKVDGRACCAGCLSYAPIL